MIDLSQFEPVRYAMRPGDIVLFDGSLANPCDDLGGAILAGGIEAVSDSVASHSAMIVPATFPGLTGPSPHLIESTILDGVDGVQTHPVEERLTSGQRAWWLALSDRFRNFLDFEAMWLLAEAKVNRDAYNVLEIGKYLARHVPILSELPALYESDDNQEVCSELVAMLLQAGGIPGLNPAICSPQTLAELRIYRACIQILGPPKTIERFNTR